MWHRHHKFMRLDGSSKISERRDMVADFQARADIFVFLLSTRAGGLGINLTAADTVCIYSLLLSFATLIFLNFLFVVFYYIFVRMFYVVYLFSQIMYFHKIT